MRLIPSDADHPGAGACYIDGGVPEDGLLALERLFAALPVHPRGRCSQALSDRSYYCDAEGWVCALLGEAMRAGAAVARVEECLAEESLAQDCDGDLSALRHSCSSRVPACGSDDGDDGGRSSSAGCGHSLPCEGHALAHMRFLHYNEAGGGLPPHTDLSRTRREDGVVSRCTFLLYLSDCCVGGETVLLEKLVQPSDVLAAVTPRRGRLLLFPHLCPHLAREVVSQALPKVLLRGEVV